MIVVKIIGGLGNQMFQIAFAKSLSLEMNVDFFLDISAYKKYKIRNFSIHNLNFSNNIEFVDSLGLHSFQKKYFKVTQSLYRIYQKLLKIIISDLKIGSSTYLFLSKFGLLYNFDPYYYEFKQTKNKVICIYGYFQSEKYFIKYRNLIREEFLVKTVPSTQEKLLLKQIYNSNAVAVSMRLGEDYTNSSSLNVCSDDYYYRAIDLISNKLKNPTFYIFSDRIDIVKNNFNFKYNVIYVEGYNDYESLRLMYTCKHFVISNSSFSWWGSYLSSNKNKIVVAPSKWYSDTKETPHIYLDSMTLIEV